MATESTKTLVDGLSVVTVVGTIGELLPPMAALFTLVWTACQESRLSMRYGNRFADFTGIIYLESSSYELGATSRSFNFTKSQP